MLNLKKDIKDIEDNKTTSLDYRNVNISNIEGLEIAQALQSNYSVKSIIIDGKKLDSHVLNAIVISCTNQFINNYKSFG
jgi:23S rRNA pseudoU1915 N3-methylase RlmH